MAVCALSLKIAVYWIMVKINPFIIRNFVSGTALKKIVGIALFLGFIGFVEHYWGWARLLAPWKTLPVGQVFAAVGLAFVSYWTRAMRLYDYFRPPRMAKVSERQEQLSDRPPRMAVASGILPETHDPKEVEDGASCGTQGGFRLCFKITLQHNLLNNLLPMRTGEISFPVLMKRYYAVPMTRSIPALLWFRLLDLHTLGACALLAGLGIAGDAVPGVIGGSILLLIWMLVPLMLFWGQGHWQRALEKKTAPGKLHSLLQKTLSSLPQSRSDFWRAWAWTVITWAVKLAVFAWVLLLFIDIAPTAALMGVIGGDLTSVLPIHGVAGMGTYEAGVIAGLLPYGITPQNALPAAVNLHLFLLASTLIGGAVSLLLGRSPREEKAHG